MTYPVIPQKQAQALLSEWQAVGSDLTRLAKLKHNKSKIELLIPDYKSNQWYQFNMRFSNYAEAMQAYGSMIDVVRK